MVRPRNAESVRQLKILQEIQGTVGRTIEQLAREHQVCARTIRRDLRALEDMGFPVSNPDPAEIPLRWNVDPRKPLAWLQNTYFSVTELAALCFSRKLLESSLASPFREELASAFEKLQKGLPERLRTVLATVPRFITAKGARVRGAATDRSETVDRLMTAVMDRRRATIVYHSFASRRVKQYLIEPYHLSFFNGGFYVLAFVPGYGQMRTFAVQRIKKLTVTEETFERLEEMADAPFGNSMGINTGPAEHVEIEFNQRMAPYIEERSWHPSQKVTKLPDGSIVLSLEVCVDWALSSWILGFGPFARVIRPERLKEQIFEEIEEARDVYAPRLQLADYAFPRPEGEGQRVLPFTPIRNKADGARKKARAVQGG